MIGIAEAVVITKMAEEALTAHERAAFYKDDPWSTVDKITVKLLDCTDDGDIRYSVNGVDTNRASIKFDQIKCISESELKKLMEEHG